MSTNQRRQFTMHCTRFSAAFISYSVVIRRSNSAVTALNIDRAVKESSLAMCYVSNRDEITIIY